MTHQENPNSEFRMSKEVFSGSLQHIRGAGAELLLVAVGVDSLPATSATPATWQQLETALAVIPGSN
jgi:hypothetical protein